MACFVVPVAQVIITSVAAKAAEKKEKKLAAEGKLSLNENKIPWSRKLKWLNSLLLGGAFLLAFEHVWHGEVVPWFPFLTAAANPESAAEMFREMATVGVAMSALVTAVWLGILGVVGLMEKRANAPVPAAKEE